MKFISKSTLLLLLCFCYGYNCLESVDKSSNKKVESKSTKSNLNEEYVTISSFMKMFGERSFDDIFETVVQTVEPLDENGEEIPDMKTCRKQWQTFIKDLQSQSYALRMADSWGRKESGILDGNVQWMGNYYECIEAEGPDFNGKWCEAYMDHSAEPNMAAVPRTPSVGICFPSGCSESSITKIFQDMLRFKSNNKTGNPTLLQVYCPLTTEQQEWTTADTIGIVVTCVILFLNLIGTFVDVFSKDNKPNDKKQKSTKDPSLLTRMALCFSMISNSEKILTTESSGGSLDVLNGIRFLSTAWVAIGHVFNEAILEIGNFIPASKYLKSQVAFMPLTNHYFSVDTFFLLGGLLVFYLGMKQLTSTKGRMNIPLMYLYRFIRITPIYAYSILFSMGLLKWLGSGPHWSSNPMLPSSTCQDIWWTNLVYINNLYPALNVCYAWCWYLAVDMQLYLLTPFILLLTYRWPRVGVSLMVFFTVASMAVCGVLSFLGPIQPFTATHVQNLGIMEEYFEAITYDIRFKYDIYYMPWARMHVYMIGMLTGYVLFATKGKLKVPKLLVVLGWLASICGGFAVIFGLFPHTSTDNNLDPELAAIYNAFDRPVYGLCLSWVIIACVCGYGGPVTKFLNWKVFNPLSRLTYSSYLVHILVLIWYLLNRNDMLQCQTFDFLFMFIGTFLFSLIVGFLLCLTIEWPVMEVAKVLLPSKRGDLSNRAKKSN
ncbi:unnamed protein product [Clavelina lepadiformis]|uniref:Nose resistant-to-fluoxetine protein N-terminal domain-containing protein n=1 Tax=Clavelina lepadiformis TaxID=159417 RepID=A0ABP0FUX5_CLALP